MKLIQEYVDSNQADKVSRRLRRSGIMAKVTSERSHSLGSNKTGALKVGLWVVFNDQYFDEIELLTNKKHKPQRVISLADMNQLEEQASNHFAQLTKRFFETTATIILAGSLVSLVVYVIWGLAKGD